jgi:hypothetical protein
MQNPARRTSLLRRRKRLKLSTSHRQQQAVTAAW